MHNFRDVGIFPLRPEALYRSGSLNRLTDVGVGRLRELGVRTVIDLRSGVESNVWPGQMRGLDIEWVPIPALPDLDALKALGFIAVLQALLGAPWDQVVEDFVRSNIELELAAGPTSFLDEAGVTRYSYPVSEALLASAMNTIRAECGSIPVCLAPHGVSAASLEALRSNLLA